LSQQAHHHGNSRNGYSPSRLLGDHGEIERQIPPVFNANFEPQRIKKGQIPITGVEQKILSLYARAISTRDIIGVSDEI
jgi:putative transposase